MYVLKKNIENFEVVDGAFAGKKFERGKSYTEIPPEEKKKFVEQKTEDGKQKTDKKK